MRLRPGSGLFSTCFQARSLLARVRGDEGGSFLVEVSVTAVIVVIVALGTFAAFDGASASSANVKSRAVGAGLAQQDQERLRAFKATDLSNYRESRSQAVAGVNYTVVSRADWVTDSTGSTSCGPAGANAQANYIATTSTVTWPKMNEVKPVVVKSLIAPPNGSFGANQGSLCVQLLCNTAGASGVNVSLTGAGSFSDVTDSTGSVFFGYVPAGNYTVTAQDAGIDRAGNTPPSKQASVVGATTSTLTVDDCQPGALRVKFDTKPAGGAVIASRNKFGFSLGNSGLAAPGFRVFFNGINYVGLYGEQSPDKSDGTATFTANGLFPFSPEPYAVWAGNCFAQRPDQIAPGAPVLQQLITPGITAGPITLRQPALNVVVNSVAGTPLKDARVLAMAKSPGCAGTIDLGKTSSEGQLDDPGLPYGNYDICAENKSSANARTAPDVRIDNPNGPATFSIQLQKNGGSCP